jgi:hypothetical protein
MKPDGSCNMVNYGYLVAWPPNMPNRGSLKETRRRRPPITTIGRLHSRAELEDLEAKDSLVYPKSDPTKKVLLRTMPG